MQQIQPRLFVGVYPRAGAATNASASTTFTAATMAVRFDETVTYQAVSSDNYTVYHKPAGVHLTCSLWAEMPRVRIINTEGAHGRNCSRAIAATTDLSAAYVQFHSAGESRWA